MFPTRHLKTVGAAASLGAIVLAGMLIIPSPGRAEDDDNNHENSNESKIKQGFAIAPVKLNLAGKNRSLVGLGSYIVNAQADCNGCHSIKPELEYSPGGNPYFNQHPATVNPAVYLAGGQDFGQFPGPGPFPHIISRNLTPDKTGMPAGGHTFQEFKTVLRTGKDYDQLHPTCKGAPDGSCLPPPFDGDLLQIMPWPVYHNMTDQDIRAIYEYLSAIPCLEGSKDAKSPLHNDCSK